MFGLELQASVLVYSEVDMCTIRHDAVGLKVTILVCVDAAAFLLLFRRNVSPRNAMLLFSFIWRRDRDPLPPPLLNFPGIPRPSSCHL